jgi:hypothetical protein
MELTRAPNILKREPLVYTLLSIRRDACSLYHHKQIRRMPKCIYPTIGAKTQDSPPSPSMEWQVYEVTMINYFVDRHPCTPCHLLYQQIHCNLQILPPALPKPVVDSCGSSGLYLPLWMLPVGLGWARFALKNVSLISEIKQIWIRFTCVSLFHYKIALLFFHFFLLQIFRFASLE